MRRMHLDEPGAQLGQAVNVARRVLREAGVHAAVRHESFRIGLRILGGERVARIREPHHVGGWIVHQARPPHARAIHDLEQRAGVVHHLDHEIPMRVLATPHHVEHVGLELAPRLHMDMHVGDARQ